MPWITVMEYVIHRLISIAAQVSFLHNWMSANSIFLSSSLRKLWSVVETHSLSYSVLLARSFFFSIASFVVYSKSINHICESSFNRYCYRGSEKNQSDVDDAAGNGSSVLGLFPNSFVDICTVNLSKAKVAEPHVFQDLSILSSIFFCIWPRTAIGCSLRPLSSMACADETFQRFQ